MQHRLSVQNLTNKERIQRKNNAANVLPTTEEQRNEHPFIHSIYWSDKLIITYVMLRYIEDKEATIKLERLKVE